ncbi:MAG: formate--phosphoribosylaminoimidazolecarboxamide ligase family protein [Thermoplasmata archaeon]|nr:formate--phosphoribosylaminoimidazolecarboxamide ligase family protein [Thermoplasmata archaeon]
MLEREEVWKIVDEYGSENIKIAAIASHSALDTFDGAKEEGFETIAICQKGREKTYANYFRTKRIGDKRIGFVDDVWIFDKFAEVLKKENQEKLRKENVVFIPNRSFTSYCSLDEIEDNFRVPLFGSRNLLRSEERGEKQDYYWLLEKEGLPFPDKIEDPREINELVIVKLHHAVKKLERGFFTASSYEEYKEKADKLIRQGVITKEDLEKARIERYIIGPVFNLDFFYSPILGELELLGIDWRFESSLDGHVRLPADQQLSLPAHQRIPEYTVCGHNAATLRESLLEKAFELGEKYVKATEKHYGSKIIGPFSLQTCVDKDLNFYIYDVAPRIGGGTNVHMFVGHPYGNSLWRDRMSTGRRIALEIKMAVDDGRLKEVVS